MLNASRAFRILALSAAASVALYGMACSSEEDTHSHASSSSHDDGPDLKDVVYEGGTHHEPLEQLLAAKATTVTGQGAMFNVPEEGAELPADTIPTFTWHDMGGAHTRRAPLPASRTKHARSWLSELVGPSVAWAHGTPYNGVAYWLVFTSDSGDTLLRVFTGNLTYTPDATAWAKLTAETKPIKVTITSAIYEQNAIVADGGPFIGTGTSFTVKP